MVSRPAVLLALTLASGLALAQEPDARPPEKFQLALGLIQRGLHDEAAQQLEQFLKESPRHRMATEGWYRLGTCRAELKQNDQAIVAFQRALAKGEAFELRPECRYRLGNALKVANRHGEAAEQYQKLVEESGADHYLSAASQFAAGECWRDAGKTDQALTAFVSSAQSDKSKDGQYAAPALYAAGFILLNGGKAADASQAFGAVADRYPAHAAAAECRYLQGEAALRAGDFEAADRALAIAKKAGGEFADDAAMGLARCRIDGGKPDDALPFLREIVKKYPDSPHLARARLEIGRILYKQGKADQAAKELGELAGSDKTSPELMAPSLELRGVALLDGGKAAEAAPLFEQALAVAKDPVTTTRLHYQLAEALAAQERWEKAAPEYRQAAGAADAALAGDALYGEALALHKLGQFDAALARLRTLTSSQPQHRLAVQAKFAEAENLFALKRFDEAAPIFAAVPADHPLARKAAFKRAWCTYLAGRAKEAAEAFGALAAGQEKDALGEEALSMVALAALQAGDDDAALAAADRYRARYRQGSFLGRTERVAARVLKKQGNLRGASERLAAASSASGATPEEMTTDRLQAAEILFQQGDFEGARDAYAKLAAVEGTTGARAIEGLAWCAFELDDDGGCRREVARGLAHPAVGDLAASLLELLTTLHVKKERWAEAEASATDFLGRFAKHARAADVSYALAVAQARSGKDEAARSRLARLAAANATARPDRVWYELAWCCQRLNDKPAAIDAFRHVVESSKDDDLAGEARTQIGEALLAEKKGDAAREMFAGVKGKHQARALYRAGFSLLDENRLADAATAFEALVALGEGELFHEGLFLVGETRTRLGQWEAAAPPLRRMVKESPDHARAQGGRLSLATCEMALRRPSEAVAAAEQFIARDDGKDRAASARANLLVGRGRIELKDYAAAEAALTKVTQLSDGELAAEAQFRLGESRRDRGELDGSVDAFLKLSILYTHPQWVSQGLLLAGRCFEDRDQKDKARKLYAELLQRFPESESAKEARNRLGSLGG